MKNTISIILILLVFSCAQNKLPIAMAIAGKYENHSTALTIQQDNLFVYEVRGGCSIETLTSKWVQKNNKEIVLEFPNCVDSIQFLESNMWGKKVPVEIVDGNTIRLDT